MERAKIYHADPEILGGTPVFTGTRVPIDTLLVYLRKGKGIEDFRDDFPTVSREQAEALLELAEQDNKRAENRAWFDLSLQSALRESEDKSGPEYSEANLKQRYA